MKDLMPKKCLLKLSNRLDVKEADKLAAKKHWLLSTTTMAHGHRQT